VIDTGTMDDPVQTAKQCDAPIADADHLIVPHEIGDNILYLRARDSKSGECLRHLLRPPQHINATTSLSSGRFRRSADQHQFAAAPLEQSTRHESQDASATTRDKGHRQWREVYGGRNNRSVAKYG
jgi:hypothetical protein